MCVIIKFKGKGKKFSKISWILDKRLEKMFEK